MGPRYSRRKTVFQAIWGPRMGEDLVLDGGTEEEKRCTKCRVGFHIPRSLTRSSFALTTSASSPILARLSLIVLIVVGLKIPIRLKSEMPACRATIFFTSSTVASAGTSMVAGSFRIGCFGAGDGNRACQQLIKLVAVASCY